MSNISYQQTLRRILRLIDEGYVDVATYNIDLSSILGKLEAIPAGGTAGQVLAKIDGVDYNTEWVTGGGGGGISDAPSDGTDYVRRDAGWESASYFDGAYGSLTGVPATFAPSAHTHTEADITDLGDYITDAPSDGTTYGRNNGAWAAVVGGGGDYNIDGGSPSSVYLPSQNLNGGGP